jgi:hypothetical protein
MTLNWLQIVRDISKNSSHRLLCLANLFFTSQSCSPGRCALRVAAHPPKPSHVELLLTHKKHAQEGERDSPLILLIPRIREGNLAAEFELICCVAWFGSCPRSCESLVGATWFRGRDAARVPATSRHEPSVPRAAVARGCHACSRPCPWPRVPRQTRSWARSGKTDPACHHPFAHWSRPRVNPSPSLPLRMHVSWSLLLYNLLCIYNSCQAQLYLHLQNAFYCWS